MVAAVSGSPVTAEAVSAYHWFKMPDLNRSTHRRLGQRSRSNPDGTGAGWTFQTICRLVHHVGRVGRGTSKKAAREAGRLGVGLQAIADEAGISVAKVRRDLIRLVDLGLVAVTRRNVTFKADPATGKIVENRTGRSLPVVVFLTIGPEHLRTKEGQDRPAANPSKMAPASPSNLEGQAVPDRDHLGGGIQREKKTERRPDGDAVGIGTPPAIEAAGLTAGQGTATTETSRPATGRPEASQGRHDRQPAIEATDGLPPRIGQACLPAGKAPRHRPASGRPFPEDHREPNAWTGPDEEARRRMLARMEEQRRRDAEADVAAKNAGNLTARQRAMSTPTAAAKAVA